MKEQTSAKCKIVQSFIVLHDHQIDPVLCFFGWIFSLICKKFALQNVDKFSVCSNFRSSVNTETAMMSDFPDLFEVRN